MHVLLPALRADVAALPQLAQGASSTDSHTVQQPGSPEAGRVQRRYLTCCVRLSPEKEPHRFVEIVEALAERPARAAASAKHTSATANGFICSSSGTGTPDAVNGSTSPGQPPTANAAPKPSQDSGSKIQTANRLLQLGVVPLLCGAADTQYAETLRARLRLAAPDAVIEQRFLSPTQLAEVLLKTKCADQLSTRLHYDLQLRVCTSPCNGLTMLVCFWWWQVFAATRLNIHPCAYDAYGMTVVEAASQGAPSLVAASGAVGATDLLRYTLL